MRRVLRKEDDRVTVEIETPWLTEAEAAAYCGGISRSTFRRKFVGIPRGGTSRIRLYHCDTLDAYIASLAQGSTPESPLLPTRRRSLAPMSIKDPITGQIYRSPVGGASGNAKGRG
ncbi:MAG: hypothetical protein ABIJ57_01075 [Pseudomonadota bacterium]